MPIITTTEGGKTDAKKFEEYRQSVPEQLTLFYFDRIKKPKYTNFIELYDALPMHYYGNQNKLRKSEQYLDPITRQFKYKKTDYSLTIHPAKVEVKEGEWREYFPSQREELVEAALIKLACDETRGVFLDDGAAVVFTLYELQKELKRVEHGYKIAEIKEALQILQKSNIELKRESGEEKLMVSESRILSLGLSSRGDWKRHGKKAKAFVRFNALVTKSIKEKTFRQLNYEMSMSFKKVLERYLYKRLSSRFTNAVAGKKHHFNLSTIIQGAGIEEYGNLRHNLYRVKEALDALKEKGVIQSYTVEERTHGRKLYDAKIVVFSSFLFAQEVISANVRAKEKKEEKPSPYAKDPSHLSNFLSRKAAA